MSRPITRLQIDSHALRLIVGNKVTWSEIAEKFGVSKQAVSGWLSEGLIPPRALIEIARELNLTAEQIDEILAPQKKRSTERKKWKITIHVESPENEGGGENG